MIEMVKRSVGHALTVALFLGLSWGGADAQETEDGAEDIQNVLLTFHLIEADGYTGQDPAISDIVAELRKLLNFEGYRLLSESVFNVGLALQQVQRSQSLGGSGSQRIVPGDSVGMEIRVSVTAARGSETARATVTLRDLRRSGSINQVRDLLQATVNMRDGQRVVLGSARRSPGEPVLILIVTARMDPDLSSERAPVSCESARELRDRTLRLTGDSEFAASVYQKVIEKQCQEDR